MLNRRFQMLMEKEMWDRIVKSAKAQNISAGEYIRKAVIEYIDRNKELISSRPSTPFNRIFNRKQK